MNDILTYSAYIYMFRFICAEAMFIGVGMSLNLATQEVVFNRIQIRASLKKWRQDWSSTRLMLSHLHVHVSFRSSYSLPVAGSALAEHR